MSRVAARGWVWASATHVGFLLQRHRPLARRPGRGRAACEHEDRGVISWALTELIEAAVRCGRDEVATAALERLSLTAHAAGTDPAPACGALTALASDDDVAEDLCREAIDRLTRTRCASSWPAPPWSTGDGCAGPAAGWRREQLRTAFEMLSEMGVSDRGAGTPRAGGDQRDRARTHR